jgi:hypothetical protein
MGSAERLPSPLRGGRTRPKAEPGGGRWRRAPLRSAERSTSDLAFLASIAPDPAPPTPAPPRKGEGTIAAAHG